MEAGAEAPRRKDMEGEEAGSRWRVRNSDRRWRFRCSRWRFRCSRWRAAPDPAPPKRPNEDSARPISAVARALASTTSESDSVPARGNK